MLAGVQSPAAADKPTLIPNSQRYAHNGAKPGTGRSGSASLAARALLGKDGKTDLEITTGQLDTTATAPGNISKTQVKFLTFTGEAANTLNSNNLSGGGYVKYTYPGLPRGQRIQVQGNVRGIDPKRTDVVTVGTAIALRPDIAVTGVSNPARSRPNIAVNINATLGEMNGDVGATTNCVLYVDGVAVDRANGVWIDAGDPVDVAFVHNFTTLGTHQIEVRAESVVPGDYDGANNSATSSIQIVEPTVDLNYSAWASDHQYYHNYYYYYSYWDPYYYMYGYNYQQQYINDYSSQSVGVNFWKDQGMAIPVAGITVSESLDGGPDITTLSATATGGGDVNWRSASAYDATHNAWLNVYSHGPVGDGGWTYGDYQRYTGRSIYYSSYYQYYYWYGWYGYSYSYNDTWGSGLPVGSSTHQVNLKIEDGNGTSYEAHPVIEMYTYYDYAWGPYYYSYGDYYYYYSTYEYGYNRYRSGYTYGP